jgi:Flp pilus assembly protein CpaB
VVGGAVHAGDHVGIVISSPKQAPSVTKFTITNVLVTKVQGAPLPQAAGTSSDQSTGETPNPATMVLVTVALATHDVEKLTWATSGNGVVWLTLENDKTNTSGSALVNSGNIYR